MNAGPVSPAPLAYQTAEPELPMRLNRGLWWASLVWVAAGLFAAACHVALGFDRPAPPYPIFSFETVLWQLLMTSFAVVLLVEFRRRAEPPTPALVFLAAAMVLLGIGQHFYYAGNVWGQIEFLGLAFVAVSQFGDLTGLAWLLVPAVVASLALTGRSRRPTSPRSEYRVIFALAVLVALVAFVTPAARLSQSVAMGWATFWSSLASQSWMKWTAAELVIAGIALTGLLVIWLRRTDSERSIRAAKWIAAFLIVSMVGLAALFQHSQGWQLPYSNLMRLSILSTMASFLVQSLALLLPLLLWTDTAMKDDPPHAEADSVF